MLAQISLITPKTLHSEMPIPADLSVKIAQFRILANEIMQGDDNRLLIIVGPCSIHDPVATLEYAKLLKEAISRFADDLFIVMRTYFEKPRTTTGWKGLINDPLLDASYDINHGLRLARKLLLELNQLGIPTATEFLNPFVPHYLFDLITWSAIGARTSESQIHRELASGLPMPVGFKNTTDGNIKIAIEAVQAASQPHYFLNTDENGASSIIRTQGNQACHIILRGSHHSPNFESHYVQQAVGLLEKANLPKRIMIDCNHGNSMKDHQRQHLVAQSIVEQLHSGSKNIGGVMLESNLVAGKQELNKTDKLIYGQSITDACISWGETLPLLEKLAYAMKQHKQVCLRPVVN